MGDKRIKVVTQVMKSIKTIKCLDWISRAEAWIDEHRSGELSRKLRMIYIILFVIFLIELSAVLLPVTTLAYYVWTNHASGLRLSTAFTTLAWLNVLRQSLT